MQPSRTPALRAVVAALAVVALAALIWWIGPLLAIAEARPLQSVNGRVIAIAVVLALLAVRALLARQRAARRNQQLFDALGKAAPVTGPSQTPDATLRTRFDAAMKVMRDLQPASARRGWQLLRPRGRYVNELPWYLFVGSPGSGKTTALLHSGLHFPLADRLGNGPIEGIGGTRHCDWWLTDQAVLIDTAGRYTTQDSDAAADAREWRAFLSLLRNNRPRQPINGALVTVSASDLLQLSTPELLRQADSVAKRLQELRTELGNSFPVYLLVTKADLFAGFSEFFANLDQERRAQVWGTTFDGSGKATSSLQSQAGDGIDALVARLREMTLARLQQEPDQARRSLIFPFADQLVAVKPALMAFVETAFARSTAGAATPGHKDLGKDASAATPLRGIYLTSGTQEGSPIDRVMGSIAHAFALRNRMLPPAHGTGKAYFLRRLLAEVVFAEASLAGTAARWQRREARLRWSLVSVAAIAATAAIAAWAWSGTQNARYVAAVASKVNVVGKALSASTNSNDLSALTPLYTALHDLAHAQAIDPAAPPDGFGYGLYQGRKLEQAALQTYRRMLAQTLAPVLAQRLLSSLRSASEMPGLQYQTLKAYLMLSDAERLDRDAIRRWVELDLAADPAQKLGPDEQQELLGHVDALLQRNAFQQAVSLDTRAVADARAALAKVPQGKRLYAALTHDARTWGLPDFRPDQAAGGDSQRLLVRTSGKPLGEPVPALFTRAAYQRGFAGSLDQAVDAMLETDDWVMGTAGAADRKRPDAATRGALIDDMRTRYLSDYAARWESLLGDLNLRRADSTADLSQSARVLSDPAGLRRLLQAALREVTLNDGGQSEGRAATLVDARFDRLRSYLSAGNGTAVSNAGGASFDALVRSVEQLRSDLEADEAAARNGTPAPTSESANRMRTQATQAPEPIKAIAASLLASVETQQQRLHRDALASSLRTAIFESCQKVVANRYPFVAGSRQDAPAAEFANLFGPRGLFETFFTRYLAAQVDTSVRPWRVRSGGTTPEAAGVVDADVLQQFERAADIRRAFFGPESTLPTMRAVMKPLDMDSAALQFTLDVDGQVLKYAHGPSLPASIQWPGPDGSGLVRMQMFPAGASGDAGVRYTGPWALLRLFDGAQLSDLGRDKQKAVLTLDGQKVEYEVTTQAGRPLRLPALQAFRCPGRP